MSKQRTWTDQDLVDAVSESWSWTELLINLGLKAGGGSKAFVQNAI